MFTIIKMHAIGSEKSYCILKTDLGYFDKNAKFYPILRPILACFSNFWVIETQRQLESGKTARFSNGKTFYVISFSKNWKWIYQLAELILGKEENG